MSFIRVSVLTPFDKDVLINTDHICQIVPSHDGKYSTINSSSEDTNGLMVAHSLDEIEKMLNPSNLDLMTKMGLETLA